MSEKRLSMIDVGAFEDAAIIKDDDKVLVMRAVIASEIVQPYHDSKGKLFYAYKPADELEKAAWTADGRWVKVLSHPKSSTLDSVEDVNGKMMNPVFRKDLNDPKTNRPCRRGIQVDVAWFKDRTPKEIIDKARKMEIKDNSIGFTCFNDPTSGEFQGQHYDVVQRNIFIDHLAAPIEKGRCPSPYCGINVDSADESIKDMWDETADMIRSGHGDKGSFDPDSFRTIDITSGIQAVIGCPKGKFADGKCSVGTETQSFLFDKKMFDMVKAKAWFTKHTGDSADNLKAFYDCPVCRRLDEIGLIAGQRLWKQYGADVLEVIEGHELPKIESAKQLVYFKDISDAMTTAQIDVKIQELHAQYDVLRAKEKTFYEIKKLEPSPELAKLYQQMGDIDNEIKAFTELKAKKIVEGNTDSAATDGEDDVIVKNRQALKDLYSLTEIFT
jgi:hypothetical protein